MAKLYYYYGAMGSSKTANALMTRFNYEEIGQKALLCKPKLDTRDGAAVVRSRKATCNAGYNENGIVREGAQVMLGSNDRYKALCRKHFKLGMLGPDFS